MPDTPEKGKGLNGWVAIFAGGKQIDMAGAEHDGDALIDKAVASFDPAFHEPPVVIGHPETDSPAWGWVSDLKAEMTRVGGKLVKTLYAKFKDVPVEFQEGVALKRWKKRSAAFYPDGRLRHVGWLGAQPPAVKGLPDPQFAEGEAVVFTFAEPSEDIPPEEGMLRKVYDMLIALTGKKTEEPDPPADEDDQASTADSNTQEEENDMPEFSEADIQKKIDEAKAEGERQGKAAAFAEYKKQQSKTKIAEYLATKVQDGGPIPALIDAGIGNFLEQLDQSKTFAFSEGAEKQTPLDFFFSEVAPRLKTPAFGEFANKRNAPHFSEGGESKVDMNAVGIKAREYRFSEQAKGHKVSPAQAVQFVMANPDMFGGE